MDKKLFKILIPALLLIGIISFCLIRYYGYSPKSFDDLLGADEANITKVLMRNGNNGSYVETTDKEKIKELINLVNDRYYKKSSNQEPRSGYSYYYDFYSGDKHTMTITGNGDNVDVNGTYYDVSSSISVDSLTNWFNSLPVHALK
ncbi:DUF5301 domain-containing protein [Clostridium sp. YIM B02515]|uniref:DUF5301 domain-containing protein n=1 Tax=Clostridium rhizosphaerae TaxID=2803861 RepID=A0ABS1TAP2_9CLOT|nr:DUF5301 domain-containing protein [Clostridium rhizosphaerae]MBL4935078.1 DUF5301 domain-containing protein [Clostridium rhizosphaerae]